MFLSVNQGPKARSLKSWSFEIFVVEPGARRLSQLESRTEMLILRGQIEPWRGAMEL